MNLPRRLALSLPLLAAPALARAQSPAPLAYPTRPIRLIVPLAAGAGAVLDHERLAQTIAHARGDGAGRAVGRAARGEGHDHADGDGGIG
ncbi:MAG: hypothetical protein JWR00_2789, partial [Rubritepida sp.]|nr:hypothetical protein [Rubritepida sp.]